MFAAKYSFLLKERKEQARIDAIKIESIVMSDLFLLDKIYNFMGREIVKQDKAEDLQYIHKLFLQTITSANLDFLSWTKFDWVDRNDNLVVNSVRGVEMKDAQNVFAQRKYVWQVKFSPEGGSWGLKFSEPAVGNMSKVNVVPVAFGVSNDDGAYLGLISSGISIAKLSDKLESVISANNQFVMIDSDHYQYVAGLGMAQQDSNLQNLINDIKNQHKYLQNDGFLEKNLKYNNVNFVYNLKMKYPFTVFVGYDQKLFWRDLARSFLSEFFILLFIAIIAEIFLFAYYKKNIK